VSRSATPFMAVGFDGHVLAAGVGVASAHALFAGAPLYLRLGCSLSPRPPPSLSCCPRYIDSLLNELVWSHAADPRRLYVCGFANGAVLAHLYACRRAARVAAFATVGGSMLALPNAYPQPEAPVPALIVHGATDEVRQAEHILPFPAGLLLLMFTKLLFKLLTPHVRNPLGPCCGVTRKCPLLKRDAPRLQLFTTPPPPRAGPCFRRTLSLTYPRWFPWAAALVRRP